MRKALLATVSGAAMLAAGPALAADMLSVGVGGYMQQWFGMASVSDSGKKAEGGTAQQSDSEIFFRGKLEADNGLTFSVKVELEGNNSDKSTAIDESQLTIGGEFGKITLGAEDPASTLTHHGGLDVGISLNCGDTHKWISGGDLAGCSHNGFGTYGHGHGDKNQIMYFTPRLNGVQVGVSYIPDTGQEGSNNALNDNMKDAWAIGGNYVGDFGGANVAVSLGHYQAGQVAAKADDKTDDKTFTNAALQVGMGSFNFGVVYATNDGGEYNGDKKVRSKDWETFGAGVKYSDGPMAFSLSHLTTEWDNKDDQNATMLSMSYSLAPGVASKTSIVAAERSTRMGDNKRAIEGTAFVTGITIGF